MKIGKEAVDEVLD